MEEATSPVQTFQNNQGMKDIWMYFFKEVLTNNEQEFIMTKVLDTLDEEFFSNSNLIDEDNPVRKKFNGLFSRSDYFNDTIQFKKGLYRAFRNYREEFLDDNEIMTKSIKEVPIEFIVFMILYYKCLESTNEEDSGDILNILLSKEKGIQIGYNVFLSIMEKFKLYKTTLNQNLVMDMENVIIETRYSGTSIASIVADASRRTWERYLSIPIWKRFFTRLDDEIYPFPESNVVSLYRRRLFPIRLIQNIEFLINVRLLLILRNC